MAKILIIFFSALCFISLSVLFFCFSLSARESEKERTYKSGKK